MTARLAYAPFALALAASVLVPLHPASAGDSQPPFLVAQAEGFDPRPASELSESELQQRIITNQRAMKSDAVNSDTRKQLRRQFNQDRKELARRGGGGGGDDQQAAEPEAQPQQQQTDDGQQQQQKPRRRQQQAEPEVQPPAEQPAQVQSEEQPQQQQQTEEGQQQQKPRRRQQQQAEPEAQPEPPAQVQSEEQPQQQKPRKRQQQQAEPEAQPQTDQPAQADSGGDPERSARRVIESGRSLRQLDARKLRQLIREAQLLARSDRLPREMRRDVRRVLRDAEERLARLDDQGGEEQQTGGTQQQNQGGQQAQGQGQGQLDQGGQGSGRATQADAAALKILSDRRPAGELRDRELRQRLQETRDILGAGGLSESVSERLRRRLAEDREVMRTRVAREEDRGEDQVAGAAPQDLAAAPPPRQGGATVGSTRPQRQGSGKGGGFDDDEGGRFDVADLVRDRRPSEDLRDRQLTRRIRASRDALESGNLRGREEARIQEMLREDRREMRHRRLSERDKRRQEIRVGAAPTIVIAPRARIAPRPDIAAAEVDEEALQEQLTAPPVEAVRGRYTVEDIRRRPDLRESMPAIELDSIHFGFNEALVREEEIDEIERIGEIIEKIVAANPEEVFLLEGHTDAVGGDGYNLNLSKKRAEAVKQALIEYFIIDQENVATIGYGKQFLKIQTAYEEQENRRVTIRRITPLLQGG